MAEKTDKKILFKANPHRHADFKLRCDYEGITQSKFFRLMLRKMIEKDRRVLSLLDEWRKENGKETKRRLEMIEKDQLDRETFEEEFGLSEQEIQNMYDLYNDE